MKKPLSLIRRFVTISSIGTLFLCSLSFLLSAHFIAEGVIPTDTAKLIHILSFVAIACAIIGFTLSRTD